MKSLVDKTVVARGRKQSSGHGLSIDCAPCSPSAACALEFSIVIPTFNRPRNLANCLKALSAQQYPKDRLEIVVVEDGGENHRVEQGVRGFNISYLRTNRGGPASARNHGIWRSKGRFIVFLDDDCEPSDRWLASLSARFREKPNCAVAGRVENGLPGNAYSAASQLLVDYLITYYNLGRERQCFGTSNNLAFPREEIVKFGGFDQSFLLPAAEDRELIDRWVSSGRELVYAPEVVVTHFHKMNLHGYSRQHLRYGIGAYDYHRVRADRSAGRIEIEPFNFYWDMVKYPFRNDTPRAVVVCALIVWSQVMNALGFFWQLFTRRLGS